MQNENFHENLLQSMLRETLVYIAEVLSQYC